MICLIGENKQDKYTSGTYDGVNININLVAAAVNQALAPSDFLPTNINVKCTLQRGRQSYTIFQDNLNLLAHFATIEKGYHEFLNGYDKLYPSDNTKAHKVRTVKLPFYGHLRLQNDDRLICEVIVPNVNAVSPNVDTSKFHIEFWANPSIGYEYYIPKVSTEVVQQNTTSQPFSCGNNITRLAFLNFDKNTLEEEVITNISISSDRIDKTYSFNQLLNHKSQMIPFESAARLSSALPISLTSSSGRVFRGLDYNPQTVLLFNGQAEENEMDDVRINASFNGENVSPSKNYFAWVSYEATAQQLADAMNREQKHMAEKLQKLPSA